jgi:RNA polymerase sigma factor (sigma-70 family)
MEQTTIISAAALREDKIEQTVKKEKNRLFSFIRKRVASREDAEDILQDVFIQFTERYSMIESIDKVTSWLFTVARNKITDLYRKKKPEPFSYKGSAGDESGTSFYDLLPDLGNTPEDQYLRSLIMERLEEALEELPAAQREIFIQNEFEDRSFKEISEETGESINTLLSRKRYAVLYLRERLKDLYNEI